MDIKRTETVTLECDGTTVSMNRGTGHVFVAAMSGLLDAQSLRVQIGVLQEALTLAELVEVADGAVRPSHVFRAGDPDPGPDVVTRIIDSQGDIWDRHEWEGISAYLEESWDGILHQYGPVLVVQPCWWTQS